MNTIQCLAFNGSPRKGGNTEVLLKTVLEVIKEKGGSVEFFHLNTMEFKPCQNCGGCDKAGTCILKDDLTPVYDKILAANRIIIASPIYFYGVSAQAKAFIDRMQALWNRKRILTEKGHWKEDPNKKGYFLSIAATKGPKIFDGAVLAAKYAFDAMGYTHEEDLLVRGIDKKGEMAEDQDTLEKARELGQKIAQN